MGENRKDPDKDQNALFSFTPADTLGARKNEQKLFPGDLSFGRDRLLSETTNDAVSAVEELPAEEYTDMEESDHEIRQEICEENQQIGAENRQEQAERTAEDASVPAESSDKGDEEKDSEEFSVEFGESINGIHSCPPQSDSSLQQASEGCAEASGYGLLEDRGNSGDGGEPEESGDGGDDGDEEGYSGLIEEDDDDEELLRIFQSALEDPSEDDEPEADDGTDGGSGVAPTDSIADTGEDTGEDSELLGVFQSVSEDEPEPAAAAYPQEAEGEWEESELSEAFGESLDEDYDVISVPKGAISVTRWDRIQLREAAASKTRITFETEHFFAVSGDYIDAAAGRPEGCEKESDAEALLIERLSRGRSLSRKSSNAEELWQFSAKTSDYKTEPQDEEDLDYDDIFNDDPDAFRRKKRKKNIVKSIFRELGLFLLITLGAIFLVVNFTVFVSRQNTVYGASMEPTLHEGDRVYTSLLPYVFGKPEVNDIIVLDESMHGKSMGYFHMVSEVLRNNRIAYWIKGQENTKSDTYWIKRVVGVAGDTLEFRDHGFYRNGQLVTENYILEQNVLTYPEGEVIVVPDGTVFVMGDNRNVSRDSRSIGCISVDIIIGKLWRKS